MSLTRPLLHYGLKPLFASWHTYVGAERAAETQVSVVGGLYLQARQIRPTMDIDVIVKSGPGIDRFQIRDNIARLDSRFTIDLEGKCGLTYREKQEDDVVSIDIIDDTVTTYMPEGMSLDEVVANDAIPLPTDSKAIIKKLIAGSDRLKSREKKAVNDFDDAMKLFGKLYHGDGVISYKSNMEKQTVKIAFNKFYPTYKAAKDEQKELR
ncbi:uncharacterized protein EI90DRAFT_3085628 [Cantharellus anzutake]|uniref:uncharacterized protein n=1 Tax=Cantharellus anzutake TaxID=1750568 RepID=UPI001907DEC8|nr:uncharacterized protein EI90DRAFT_3085628 [Cantharellus anzutake]KAF8316998.1 hypothetical protein EI90DRAFT_3085628 [Cantharellus anzutake]